MSNRTEKISSIIGRKGAFDVLSFLFDVWFEWKKGKRDSNATTFSNIMRNLRNLHLSTRTLSLALISLRDSGLIEREGKRYSLSDLGLYICPLLEPLQMASTTRRVSIWFSDKDDPRSWIREVVSLIVGTSEELLITTRWLSSFQRQEFHEVLSSAFNQATQRNVAIRVIADPQISKKVLDVLRLEFKVETRFLPKEILENPPKMLKPIFLDDFAHVMIADRTHWLYILPHAKEGIHVGRRSLNDPVIAKYLADIFESFWSLSMNI